jgi:hypothetical protein
LAFQNKDVPIFAPCGFVGFLHNSDIPIASPASCLAVKRLISSKGLLKCRVFQDSSPSVRRLAGITLKNFETVSSRVKEKRALRSNLLVEGIQNISRSHFHPAGGKYLRKILVRIAPG